jgi:hypothetical protein
VFLILASSVCFYLPSVIFSLSGFNVETVPKRFYDYYAFMMAGALCLNIIYAFFLFMVISPKNLYLKLPVLWLLIAESYTLIYHVINKIWLLKISNSFGKIATVIIFVICCSFFIFKALFRQKSEEFDPRKTYVVNFLPKDILGIFNWLKNHTGHKGIYQDGKIYAFKRRTGRVEAMSIEEEKENAILKEIPRISDIDRLIGKEFSLFHYNCNTMVKDATGN